MREKQSSVGGNRTGVDEHSEKRAKAEGHSKGIQQPVSTTLYNCFQTLTFFTEWDRGFKTTGL